MDMYVWGGGVPEWETRVATVPGAGIAELLSYPLPQPGLLKEQYVLLTLSRLSTPFQSNIPEWALL